MFGTNFLRNFTEISLQWGHMHVYERTCPVKNLTCVGDYENPGGPVHMVKRWSRDLTQFSRLLEARELGP